MPCCHLEKKTETTTAFSTLVGQTLKLFQNKITSVDWLKVTFCIQNLCNNRFFSLTCSQHTWNPTRIKLNNSSGSSFGSSTNFALNILMKFWKSGFNIHVRQIKYFCVTIYCTLLTTELIQISHYFTTKYHENKKHPNYANYSISSCLWRLSHIKNYLEMKIE